MSVLIAQLTYSHELGYLRNFIFKGVLKELASFPWEEQQQVIWLSFRWAAVGYIVCIFQVFPSLSHIQLKGFCHCLHNFYCFFKIGWCILYELLF